MKISHFTLFLMKITTSKLLSTSNSLEDYDKHENHNVQGGFEKYLDSTLPVLDLTQKYLCDKNF